MPDVVGSYTSIVYWNGSSFVAQDRFGNLLQSLSPVADPTSTITASAFPNPGPDPGVLIQAALNRGGDVYVAGGRYELASQFEKFELKNFTRVTFAKDAQIVVQNGFSGTVFELRGVQGSILEGGYFTEISASSSVGWVSSNHFSDFSVYAYRVGIRFSAFGHFNRNHFESITFQPHPIQTAETGIDDIRGNANLLENASFYDAIVNGVERITGLVASIYEDALSTLINSRLTSCRIPKISPRPHLPPLDF